MEEILVSLCVTSHSWGFSKIWSEIHCRNGSLLSNLETVRTHLMCMCTKDLNYMHLELHASCQCFYLKNRSAPLVWEYVREWGWVVVGCDLSWLGFLGPPQCVVLATVCCVGHSVAPLICEYPSIPDYESSFLKATMLTQQPSTPMCMCTCTKDLNYMLSDVIWLWSFFVFFLCVCHSVYKALLQLLDYVLFVPSRALCHPK